MNKKNYLTIFLLILVLLVSACGPTAMNEAGNDEPAVNELPDAKPDDALRPAESETDENTDDGEAYPAPAKDEMGEADGEKVGDEAYPAPFDKDDSVASGDEAYPAPPDAAPAGDEGATTGAAMIEGVELRILESFPVQVDMVVSGMLPDSCTTLGPVDVEQDGNTFNVTVHTTRPADMLCAQVVTNFEEAIPLDVQGLPAGTYTVDVNGFANTFTLDVDNG